MIKKVTILFFVTITIFGCEKDDICDTGTPTTTQMVVKFYSANNTIQRVVNLQVIAFGTNDTLILNKSQTGIRKYLLNDTILYLPLRIDGNTTKYKFIHNSIDPIRKRTDDIQFNYERENIFVSRACGFKTNFDINGAGSNPFVLNNNPNLAIGNWMLNIQLIQPKVNNEKITNFKILF